MLLQERFRVVPLEPVWVLLRELCQVELQGPVWTLRRSLQIESREPVWELLQELAGLLRALPKELLREWIQIPIQVPQVFSLPAMTVRQALLPQLRYGCLPCGSAGY